MIFRSFAGKIWIVIVAWVFLVLLIFGGILAKSTHDFYYGYAAEENEELTDTANSLAFYVSSLQNIQSADDHFAFLGNLLKYDLLATNADGKVILGTHQIRNWLNFDMPVEDIAQLRKGQDISYEGKADYASGHILKVAAPIIKDNQFMGGIFVIEPMTYLNAVSISVTNSIGWGLTLSFLLAVPLGLLLAKRVASPVVEMDRAIKDIATGNYSRPLPANSTDELASLGHSFNTLSDEIKQKIHENERERQQLANILGSIEDGVLTISPTGQVILANRMTKRLLEPVIGGASLTLDNLPQSLRTFLLNSMLEPIPHQGEFRFKDQVYSVETSPLITDQECGGLVAVWHNITKEKQLEDLRRDFVANVSHELRTPLSYLQGYSEALLDNVITDEEKKRSYLETIHNETLRMRRLVNDLLELNRIQYGGALELPHERVYIHNVLEDIKHQIEPVSEMKNVRINFEYEANIKPINGGTDRLKQIMLNLIDNALRYSPEGGEILIAAKEKGNKVKISVTDQGPGIPAEEQVIIWDRFKQGRYVQEYANGSGLGLAIAKNLVEAYEGEVGLNSELGKGSTFSVSFPVYQED
ncbi:signal transduction histidine kinase [Desulfosporosinus acidiphilus SJ4]|uniref:histidine kinase n=1 Tax=Desulfosporosinus acidiphilus (strain DSM 22704 / JCM 16185 / SJ4) TaxID=646529 RepID=I4D2B3_DESAJ|nr:ATP-binding protein [Desulfosporosinus acidiphilus]AFM39937.1 signal transduction histidine kinase [Desulfosporosinus acidiphilus SJ4]